MSGSGHRPGSRRDAMTEPKPMLTATPLAAGNDAYVEAMYERATPISVPGVSAVVLVMMLIHYCWCT